MYALAIHDRRANRLVLARDRMGIKPLYYARHGDRLVFSSELRALRHDAAGPSGRPSVVTCFARDRGAAWSRRAQLTPPRLRRAEHRL